MPNLEEVEYIEIKSSGRKLPTFWIFIAIGIAILAMTIIILTAVSISVRNYEKEINPSTTPTKKIGACAEENYSYECQRDFIIQNPGWNCEESLGPKDDCYEILAEINQDIVYCSEIENQTRRDLCFSINFIPENEI